MKPNGFSYYFAIRKRSNMIPVSLDFASLWKKKKYKNETPTPPPLPFHPSPFLFPSHKSVIYSLTPSWNVLQISFFYSYSNKMRFIFITRTHKCECRMGSHAFQTSVQEKMSLLWDPQFLVREPTVPQKIFILFPFVTNWDGKTDHGEGA